jgi:hypothetical protein
MASNQIKLWKLTNEEVKFSKYVIVANMECIILKLKKIIGDLSQGK